MGSTSTSQRRGADPDQLRHRHRRRQGGADRQQPRQAGRDQAAARGAPPGRDGGEGLLVVPAGAGVLLRRRQQGRPDDQQLRDAERARFAQARAGHDQRADLRRQGLRDAHLAAPRPAGAVEAHHQRHRARDQRAERAVRRRQGGPGAHRRRAGDGLHHHHAGPAVGPQAVRRDHRARQPRRQHAAPEGRGARRARLEGLRLHRPRQRQGRHAGGHLPAARRQCAQRGQGGRPHGRDVEQEFPQGHRALGGVRHHALRQGVDRGGGQDAGRGDGAGDPGGVPVPAELARHVHSRWWRCRCR